jgi:hypothetical protein
MNIKAKNIGQVIGDNYGEVNQNIYLPSEPGILPQQIPDSKGFFGREDYLEELREWYGSGKRVFVLHGLGGVGKTALAYKFAEEIKTDDCDAHIYINLQGQANTLISSTDAMLQVLHSFNQNVPTDTSSSEIESLFVSILNKHRVLLLVDNAKERTQVEPLNKSKNTCLLVTSRESFVLSGGESRQIKLNVTE